MTVMLSRPGGMDASKRNRIWLRTPRALQRRRDGSTISEPASEIEEQRNGELGRSGKCKAGIVRKTAAQSWARSTSMLPKGMASATDEGGVQCSQPPESHAGKSWDRVSPAD